MRKYKFITCAFTGVSNSGKTTLIEKISNKLSKNYKVCIIKHDPKDKSVFDTKGKDSYRFYNSGADVAVFSPHKTAMFFHGEQNMSDVIRRFGDFDYLFIEGLKHLDFRRICVARGSIDESYIDYVDAFAVDGSIDKTLIPGDKTVLDLNNIDEIIKWIDEKGQR